MGGKSRTDSEGGTPKAWDHDPPAKRKWTPFGVLMLASGALTLIFGSRETSDFRVDALKAWWLGVKEGLGHVRRLVIHLDDAEAARDEQRYEADDHGERDVAALQRLPAGRGDLVRDRRRKARDQRRAGFGRLEDRDG